MNFKIENNFIDITNYPSIERHFEKMASKGWLINKIIAGNIFFYKKIEPEKLDFSIALYEVETAFTRKSKEELDEFNSVCQSVGWNYATKSFDLHIYFKEKGSDAMDIQTDEEEEFRTLEFIGRKYIKSYYFQIPFILFLIWINLGSLFTSVYALKDGFGQLLTPVAPLGLILIIVQIIHIKKFLKLNRNNIEMGKEIKYSESKFYFYKITFLIIYLFLFILIIYTLYLGIYMKNRFLLLGFLPILVGATIGALYRYLIKPSKISKRKKTIGFIVTIVIAVGISIMVSIGSIISIPNEIGHKDKPNIVGYKVLSIKDFEEKITEYEGDLMESSSILIPKSYEYYSYGKNQGSIVTEYSKALTEGLAKNLVDRYIRQAKIASIGRHSRDLEYYLEEGVYDENLLSIGITKENFEKLIKEDKKSIYKLIEERAIIEDKENLWNADEVYFLTYDKTQIVIRNGKEVFYLDGKDFSDIEIINIIKEKLELN